LAQEQRKIRRIQVSTDHRKAPEQTADSEAVIQSGMGIQNNPNKGGTFRPAIRSEPNRDDKETCHDGIGRIRIGDFRSHRITAVRFTLAKRDAVDGLECFGVQKGRS
jgi:hypothetical protein